MRTSLEYIEQAPSVLLQDSSPLLLLLHGLGSNEQDLFSFAPHLDPRYRILSVRAPQRYSYGGYAWFDINFGPGAPQPNQVHMEASGKTLLTFIEEVSEQYHPSRIYLGGFSQGAIMSYLTALSNPTLLSGVLGMSGYIHQNDSLPTIASEALQKLPIFATHGVNDQVLPVFLGRSTRDYFQSLHLNYIYQEYPMGHEVSQACFEDCRNWLAQQVADLT